MASELADNVQGNSYYGAISDNCSEPLKSDVGLATILKGLTITWSFSLDDYNRTAKDCNNSIIHAIYYKKNGSLVKLRNLNSGEYASDCDIENIPGGLRKYTVTGSYIRNGTKLYYVSANGYDTQISGAPKKVSYALSNQLTVPNDYIWGGRITFSNISIPNNQMDIGINELYYGVEDNEGNIKYAVYVASIEVLAPVIHGITIDTSNCKLDFYKNEPFTYEGLVVTGIFYYQLGNYEAKREPITGYKVRHTTIGGRMNVIVEYQHFTKSYSANIYGVKKVSFESPRKDFKLNENYVYDGTCYIEFDDGTSVTIPGSEVRVEIETDASGEDVGCLRVHNNVTNEDSTEYFSYTVWDVQRILLDIENVKKVYNSDEDLDLSGIIITADYGDAGTEIVPVEECQVTNTSNEIVPGYYSVTIAYRNKSSNFTVKYEGLESIRLFTDTVTKKFLKGSEFSYEGLKVFATGSNYDEVEIPISSSEVFISNNIDFEKAGSYTVNVIVSRKGIVKSLSYSVEVYTLTSLELLDYKDTFYFLNNEPVFSTGALRVVAHYSDGRQEDLPFNRYSLSVPSSMNVGNHDVVVTATIGDTVSSYYQVSVIKDSPVRISKVENISWVNVFSKGQQFTSRGIKVYCDMQSGSTDVEVSFRTNLDNQVFGADITEDTNISVNVDGIGEPYQTSLTALYDSVTNVTFDTKSFKKTYKAGETIDLTGIKVIVEHAHSDSATYYEGVTTTRHSAFLVSEKGNVNIPLSFNEYEGSVEVKVVAIESIQADADKMTYIRNEKFDSSKVYLTKTYSDGLGYSFTEPLDVNLCTISGNTENMLPGEDGLTTRISFLYIEALTNYVCSIDFNVKCVKSVELDINDDAINKNFGDKLSLSGYILTVKYNTGETFSGVINASGKVQIDTNIFQVNSFPQVGETIVDKVENSYISIGFGGETIKYFFTIHCKYLDKIVADVSSVVGKTYYENDLLDLTGVSVNAIYKSTNALIPEEAIDVTNNVTYSRENGEKLTAGNNSVVVTYSVGELTSQQIRTTTFSFNVNEITLESISVDASSLSKALNTYVEGQRLNISGLKVTAHYNNSTSQIDLTRCKFYIGVKEVSPNEILNSSMNGEMLKVVFTSNGISESANVGILGVDTKKVTSIAVNPLSNNELSFYIGDYFSSNGLIIEVTYNDGYKEDIRNGFTTDYDRNIDEQFTIQSVGSNKNVTVSYQKDGITKTCYYQISILVPSIKDIRLDTTLIDLSPVNNSSYSLNGLIVYAIFSNDYEERIEHTNWLSDATTKLGIEADGKINVTPGTIQIVISVTNPYDQTNTVAKILPISVVPNMELQDIRLKFNEDDNPFNYFVGDTYNAKGVIVQALFKDEGDYVNVQGFTTNPELGTILRSGGRREITVTYISQGVIKTATYTIVIAMSYESGITETNSYGIAFNVKKVIHEETTIEFGERIYPLFDKNYLDISEQTGSEFYGLNVYVGDNADRDCVGYITLGATADDGSVIENAKVVLFDDPVNPIDGDSNIVVKFPHYVPGFADRINHAHFGIIYNKRLFVSGNPTFKNVDWHSGEVNSSQVENYDIDTEGDFTYFSDLDYCRYGSNDTAIVGYSIYRDGSLVVFKEGSRNEATIFTRTATYVTASSYDGQTVNGDNLAEDHYPMKEVNANGGEGIINVINFAGETIAITKTGVKALINKEQNYGNSKYTFDVSTSINPRIKNEELENSYLFSFKDRLLLKTKRGLYVGENVLRNENNEYEWYFLDNIDAHMFFELDDQLYFSDKSGNIRRFVDSTNDNRYDRKRTYVGIGGTLLQIDTSNDSLIVSKNYASRIVEGNKFHLLSHISASSNTEATEYEIYANLGLIVNKETRKNLLENGITGFDQTEYIGIIDDDENTIEIKRYDSLGNVDDVQTSEDSKLFYNDRKIYFDLIKGSTSVNVNKDYYLKEIDSLNPLIHKFKVCKYNGEEIDLSGIETCRLSFRVSDLSITTITDVRDYGTDGAKSFKLMGDHGRLLDLIYYDNKVGTYSGVITENIPVKSHFATKAFNFGSIASLKTIYLWVIANDTNLKSYMDVGYLFSRKQGDYALAIKTASGSSQLDFGEIRFDKIQFSNDKLPHIYSKYKILANVGAIRFLFRNYEGTNMVLSHFSLVYAIGQLMKGVK